MSSNNIFEAELADLKDFLANFADVPDEMWNYISAHIHRMSLSRNSYLIRKGDTVDKIYFVRSGLMRVYYSKEDGTEINRNFVFENRFFTNSLSLLTSIPSHYEVQALEDTRLLYFAKEVLESIYEKYPVGNKIGRLLAEQNFIEKELKEIRLRNLSPEEHYLFLVNCNSKLLKRIPQYHIASYLGITPETLSRIRNRIAKNVR